LELSFFDLEAIEKVIKGKDDVVKIVLAAIYK